MLFLKNDSGPHYLMQLLYDRLRITIRFGCKGQIINLKFYTQLLMRGCHHNLELQIKQINTAIPLQYFLILQFTIELPSALSGLKFGIILILDFIATVLQRALILITMLLDFKLSKRFFKGYKYKQLLVTLVQDNTYR